MSDDRHDVFVGLASIPERESSLRTVIERLLPQARRIGVYLNRYETVPGFLQHDRIVVARSQDHGDVRDNGKFFFLDRCGTQYYATVDDDIAYPTNYIDRLIVHLQEAPQPAAVGVHGAVYPDPVIDMFDSRLLWHFEHRVPHVMPAHLLGTGTTAFDQSAWQLRFEEFGMPGMADVWFARAAQERGAGLFVVPRRRRWMEPIKRERDTGGALFHEGLHHGSRQLVELRASSVSERGFDGLIGSLVASRPFSERLSLHHAVQLDAMRRQIGLSPLSPAAATELGDRLASVRGWWTDHPELGGGAQRIAGLVVDVLADRIGADEVVPVVATLERLSGLARLAPRDWETLPEAVRSDAHEPTLGDLRAHLLGRALRSAGDASPRIWDAFASRSEITAQTALAADRAGVYTDFERLPALVERARENPAGAAGLLFQHLEATGWERLPDVNALRRAFGAHFDDLEVALPLCLAAARSGADGLARRMHARMRRRLPWDIDVRLMAARLEQELTSPAEALRPVLRILDEALVAQDLLPCEPMLSDTSGGSWIHSLSAGTDASDGGAGSPTVSVLMTTHNDAGTVEAAIRSILAASDVTVQLVLVDDASTDGTPDVIGSIDDPRLLVIRNERNLGPYVSRNRGLEHVTGDFVAIADADDWSHPQRLRYQCGILADSPDVLACKVAHVRISANGELDLENHSRFVGEGPMSLMYRRWLVDHIGGFDHIRTRGDVEFMRRLTARFGDDALVSSGTPLVLATSSPRSNSKRFDEESLNQYRASSRRWHDRRRGTDELYVPLRDGRAPFIAPHDLRVE